MHLFIIILKKRLTQDSSSSDSGSVSFYFSRYMKFKMIDVIYNKWYYNFSRYAGVAELADAPDLGSGALRRGGSSPFSRTNFIAPLEVLFFLPKIRC